MKEALLHMIILIMLDAFLIFVISVISIAVMESKKIKGMRKNWQDRINEFWTYARRLNEVLKQDIYYNWKGLAVLLVSITVILLIAWAGHFICCSYFVNILCTIIAIVLIFVVLRPRLYIDNQLYVLTIKKDDKRLKVRIKNLGLFPVNNVEVQVLLYRYLDHPKNEDKRTNKLELLRPDSPILRGLFARNEEVVFGCGTEKSIPDIYEKWKDKQYEGILCRVSATHVISGVTYVRERRFLKDEVEEFFAKYGRKDIGSPSSKLDKARADIEDAQSKLDSAREMINQSIKENKKK